VRHVTLTFGSLAFAGCALGPDAVMQPGFLAALLGVLAIGVLNFGVSFALALGVALRARDASLRDGLLLLRVVAGRLLREPRTFLLPPHEEPEPELAGEPSAQAVSAPAPGGPGA
jgi:site-specific recombinase